MATHSQLIIESIADEESLRRGATEEDLAYVATFASENRRCEVLAWRAIVRREFGEGVRIFYDDYGAPKIDNPSKYISVSHSRQFVSVLISDQPCAVDIEDAERNFRRVATRYLSAVELSIAEQYNLFAEMWSAKEALYKYYKKGKLDFVRDISIESYNPEDANFVATILRSEAIVVDIERYDNIVVATIG